MSSSAKPAGTPFAGHALLISDQGTGGGQIMRAMQQFAFTVDVCSSLESASRLVAIRKFQAIVLNIGPTGEAARLLDAVRSSASNHSAVTFAVIAADAAPDSQLRPNFLLHKPVTEALLTSTLKAAMGLIVRDYRRYFRCPLTAPASICVGGGSPAACELINISEGGVALGKCVPLELGSRVTVQFELPDVVRDFVVEAEVCWSDGRSRAGLHFCSLTSEQNARLQAWLSVKIEETFPDPILQLFRNPR